MIYVNEIVKAEVEPFCHMTGCSCPTGYELINSSDSESKTCRLLNEGRDNAPEEEEERREAIFFSYFLLFYKTYLLLFQF